VTLVFDHEKLRRFETREGAEESSRAAAAWLTENLPDMNVAARYVTAGEVLMRC